MHLIMDSKTLITSSEEINNSVLDISKICQDLAVIHPSTAHRLVIPLSKINKNITALIAEIKNAVDSVTAFKNSQPVKDLLKDN